MLCVCGCANKPVLSEQIYTPQTVVGFNAPESALQTDDGRIYVSEIGTFNVDGDGKISVIMPDGTRHTLIAGLNDPKGMAIYNNILFVTDKTRVLAITPNGKAYTYAAATSFPRPPQFLNDLSADAQGNLYVSDSGDVQNNRNGAIYKIGRDSKILPVMDTGKDARFHSPNGILVANASTLYYVEFAGGELYQINLNNQRMQKLAGGFGNADGVVQDEHGLLYISDWRAGKIYQVNPQIALANTNDTQREQSPKSQTGIRLINSGLQGPADIGLTQDGRFLLVPEMQSGQLTFVPVPYE